MWFKNLHLYRLGLPCELQSDALAERLSARPLVPCGGLERQRLGWVPPAGGEAPLLALNGQFLIALGIEEKLLPATVVRQVAQDRVAELEAQQGFRIGRKRLREVREAVEDELLPRAFSKRSTVHAWIDPVHGWLVVDSAGASRAEALIKLLGDSVADISPRLLHTRLSPTSAMTAWLAAGEGPEGFSIDRDCELRFPGEDRATVRYVRHPLDGDEIRAHIAAGKQATRLGMTWADRIAFVLNDKLEIKRLTFLDILKAESEQAEDAEAARQVEFALMSGELARLFDALVAALGGEDNR